MSSRAGTTDGRSFDLRVVDINSEVATIHYIAMQRQSFMSPATRGNSPGTRLAKLSISPSLLKNCPAANDGRSSSHIKHSRKTAFS